MELVSQIVGVLRDAAEQRKILPYRRLHEMFLPEVPLRERYRALELAVTTLAQPRWVDYGALLALDNGLPGDEFFIRFRGTRRSEYDDVMGIGTCGRSVTKRRKLAQAERIRVYDHARQVCDARSRGHAAYG